MRKICLAVALFCLIDFKSNAQVDPVGDFNRHVFEGWKGEVIRIGQYQVKGSPYLLGESFPGSIIYKAGGPLKDVKILYDVFNQKAGVDLNKEIFEVQDVIERFSISLPDKMGGQNLEFSNCSNFGKPEMKCFFNVLEDGNKIVLLKAFRSKLVADPSNNMDTKRKVFEQYYEYYVYVKSSQTLNEIKLRKKDLVRELGNEKFIDEYMKNNDTDVTKEFELIQLVSAFNNKL